MGEKYQEGAADIHIKIADFGLSRDYASNYMTGTLGTYVRYYLSLALDGSINF